VGAGRMTAEVSREMEGRVGIGSEVLLKKLGGRLGREMGMGG